VIKSFKNDLTRAAFEGEASKRFPADLLRVTRRKLQYLSAAVSLNDLRSPPGNRLEALKHDRAGQHSIRVNDQFRICFIWTAEGPTDVELTDYHQTAEGYTMTKKLAPMHPGEVLREEFLIPLNLSPGALAKVCGVPRTRIERLANESTSVTANTALRLSKALNTSAQLWLNLQNAYDVRTAEIEIGKELAKIEPIIADAA
jgi:addiction module HigA family antidote